MANESPVAVLFDKNGNEIEVALGAGGHYHLATAMSQHIVAAPSNSTSAQLAAGASFTGTAESIFDVASIQVNVFGDQPMLVSLEQSNDGANWIIKDEFNTYANVGDARTIYSLAYYFRIIVTNLGTATTTTFELAAALCPTVEVLPRSLTPQGHLSLSRKTVGFYPSPENFLDVGQNRALVLDTKRSLCTRSAVLTDEESYRDDFSRSSLYENITGNVYFRNGTKYVVGDGTSFLDELNLHNLIKLDIDSADKLIKITDIYSDTLLELESEYQGTTISGVCQSSNWYSTIETGCSINESSSELILTSGTTNGSLVEIHRSGDYGPFSLLTKAKIDNRRANQLSGFGFANNECDIATKLAIICLSGTDDTKVTCRTSFSLADVEDTEVTLPNGKTTATYINFVIDVLPQKVTFWADGIRIATHYTHIPGPYDGMDIRLGIKNTGAVGGSTDLTFDYISWENFNKVQISTNGEPINTISRQGMVTTYTDVAAAAADTCLLTASSERVGATIFNDSTAILYIKLTTGASASSFGVRLLQNDYYELPYGYKGIVYGYWASATGFARIQEIF